MNKHELVGLVAEKAELSNSDAEKAVDALLDTIVDALVKGEAVKITGFGIFEKKERAARIGTNPASGEKIEIAAAKSVGFKVSKNLKEKLN
ncbi:MAG: HU family DNA-binding protein [Firmicutes bacterium]|uniref:HU family DNA-binding protein n=1 Tax=Candidatus Alloenteromonas pullistercoris TaxID=2840785 RepID=A0A9D9GVF7_9FIRM|nr:HU family DNA-binding protein [Candidatus Enteromonas pullistercoris]